MWAAAVCRGGLGVLLGGAQFAAGLGNVSGRVHLVRLNGLLALGGDAACVATLSGSEFEVAATGDGIDTGLDGDFLAGFGGGDVAVAQVADGALAHGDHAAEADAHAAAARHQDTGLFARVEDRGATLGVRP